MLSISCENIFDSLELKSSVKRAVENINISYKGIVIDKYAPRKNMEPTHLSIKTEKDTISICPNDQITNYASIGDTIIKIKDENTVKIITRDGIEKDFFYIKIPKRVREHKEFPKNWKDKWLDSTIDNSKD
jgi:hypothetical protein